ncbi:urease accessory protein UreD [Vibrio viridaestus]|uniref:Urease accessory protein UreD n=1 Tax=Vibrio viridaestus TaxID=2487322 RepID=A0A3N9THY6_9VIBR|nr:urease accessory protein UreD [Vibrio viridaestus]RQW63514.1 urease accessory protein UreD [Vibrio viridaestus]
MSTILPNLDLSTQSQRHWPARLSLGFDYQHGKTRMHQMSFHGPLRVQRPFFPEGDVCHVYLLHPPGGLVSGDELVIDIESSEQGHALVTTPSAGKIYKADSKKGVQQQQVNIDVNDACVEWLPMETIVFDGAHGRLETRVNLFGNAKFVGIDVFCLGRPKSDLPFLSGSVEQRLAIYKEQTPILLERQYIAADDPLIHAMSGFNGNLVSGTMIIYGLETPDEALAIIREHYSQIPGTLSASYRMGVLVIRYLGHCSEEAQQQLRHCWTLVRPMLLGKPACPPRIWNT